MEKKESNIMVSGFKVVIVVMLAVALWPVLSVLMSALAGVITFGLGVICIMGILIGIVYMCGYTFESAKKGVPDNIEERVRGRYDKARDYLKEKLKNKKEK